MREHSTTRQGESAAGLPAAPAVTAANDTDDMGADTISRGAYRPVPHDFVQRWPQVGWGGAEAEWRAHARNVAQWVDECGRDGMVLARKAYLTEQRATQGRSRRKSYVLGRTHRPGGRMVGQGDQPPAKPLSEAE